MTVLDDARRLAQSAQTTMRPFSAIAAGAAVVHAAASTYHEARENRTSLGSSLLAGAVGGAAAVANRISGPAVAVGVVNAVAHVVDRHHTSGLAEATGRLAAGTPQEILRSAIPVIQVVDSMTRYDRAAGERIVDRQLSGQYGEFARTTALIGTALSGERGRSEIIERAADGRLGQLGRLATGLVDRLSPPAGQTFQRSAVTDRPAEHPHQQPHHRAEHQPRDEPRGEPARVSTYTDPDTGERFHIISNSEAKLVEPDEPGEQGGPTWTIEKDAETGAITHVRSDGESMTVIRGEDVAEVDAGTWTTEKDTATGEEWDVFEQGGEMTFVPHEPDAVQSQPLDSRAPSDQSAASSPQPVADRHQAVGETATSGTGPSHRPEYSPPTDSAGSRTWAGDRPPGSDLSTASHGGRTWTGDRPPGSDLSTARHGGGGPRTDSRSGGQDERTQSEAGRSRLDDRQQGVPSVRPDAGERQQRQERDVGNRTQDARSGTSSETQRQGSEERQREADRQRQQQSEQRVGGRNQQ